MTSKKKPKLAVTSRLKSALRVSARHFEMLALMVMLLVIVIGGSYWGWQLLQKRGLNDDQYRVDAEDIVVTTESEWIAAHDLKAQVLRDASLDEAISILDDNVAERVALAFKAHPWVREVRAEKFHPARIEVTIVYREPVAVVTTGNRLLPVDQEGVLLPIENFPPYRLLRFAQINGDLVGSPPAAGLAWHDTRVAAAATIAAAFVGTWHEFGLAEIAPSALPVADEDDVFTFELVTAAGMRIPWGRQYLQLHDGEPSAAEKRDRLKRYIDLNGDLDGLSFDPARAGERRTAKRQNETGAPR